MILSSINFADGASLPFECSYESRNLSPSLRWTGAPLGTRSFAVTCQDRDGPDAKPWTLWLLWNIPATETRLRQGLPQYPRLDDGMEQGLNDYLEYGWCGPCPPVGLHEYSFALYALDSQISPVAPTPRVVLSAISAHVIDVVRVTATFGS
ncbi:MAG: YbhB/YbcL family Raf kinase inhibitor-like protein, partial [Spirochaetes bacterium]|nr:YbhB/YbcL family Raf kinase inhibitor-like protein [Spirochaetota bacterium]